MEKNINYQEIETQCKSAIIKAGKISKELKKNLKVHYKSENQPVTNADLEINNFLKNILTEICPNYGWFSEESVDDESRLKKNIFWCLDPIDGTRSYIYNKPEYTISLALINKKTPILGFIYNPCTEEFFFSKKNHGSFCNGERIFVNKKRKINECTVAISSSEKKKWDSFDFLKKIRIIKMGSIAYKIALVAKGNCDVALSFTKKNDWDLAAADLLVSEAGGEIKTIMGEKINYNTDKLRIDSVMAGNLELTSDLIKVLKKSNEPK